MIKKSHVLMLLILSVFMASCTTNNSSPTTVTVINNNYVVTEFQQGILPYAGYAGCADMNMANTAPSNTYNFGASSEGSMGYYGSQITHYLVKFDIGSIPSGVTVKKAYLTLYSPLTHGAGNISTHKKTSDWLEGSSSGTVGIPSWNSTSGGETYDTASSGTVTIAGAKYYTFELNTAMVQEWVNNSSVNYGVLIKGDDETIDSWIWCYFKEDTTPANRPKLSIYYTVQ